jgi:hypothetical protein
MFHHGERGFAERFNLSGTSTSMKQLFLIVLLAFGTGSAIASDEFTIEGVMRHTDLEGGCWYLDTEGKKYELRAGDETIRRTREEGKYFKLLVRKSGGASICMVGQIVDVVEVIDTVRHPIDPMIMQQRVVGKIRKKAKCWYVRTAKGKTYELQGTLPKRWKKVGARFDERVRVIAGSFSKCGAKYVIVGLDKALPKPKAQRGPAADPR